MFPLIVLEEVESTSDALKLLCRNGDAHHGMTLAARVQTRGRGRHGREWFSLPGNIMLSVALKRNSRDFHPQLSLVVGMAVCHYLRGLIAQPDGLTVKWPNDLLWNGKKTGGILLETEGDFLIAGIGINLVHSPDVMGAEAISLAEVLQERNLSASACYSPLRHVVMEAVGVWEKEGFAPFYETWDKCAFPQGSQVRVRQGGTVQTGLYDGIANDGALWLKHDGQRQRVDMGEVVLLEGDA
jgi:BirA family biotin operon repressor/biotin-[acetyl-CoA-carboxylase] ligase